MIRAIAVGLAFFASTGALQAQSVETLQRKLHEREREIEELKRKIRSLEQQAGVAADEDDEMNRALERALVQQGGLVLRRGTYEVEPELSYAQWDKSRDLRNYRFGSALSLRAGLGMDAQAQVRVPYVYVSTAAGSNSGLGDVDFSLSGQLLEEAKQGPG